MNIYLIRHGELYWVENQRKCIGITDIGLSDEGVEMAKNIGNFLENKKIVKIYTSNLKRCIDTAIIIGEYLRVSYCIEEELREINMGIWENKTFKEIKEKYPMDYKERGKHIKDYRITKGETFQECYDRVIKIFNDICRDNYKENNDDDNGNIAIVTHSGVIKCILSYIKNIHLNQVLDIKQRYGAINCIYYNENGFKINYYNK